MMMESNVRSGFWRCRQSGGLPVALAVKTCTLLCGPLLHVDVGGSGEIWDLLTWKAGSYRPPSLNFFKDLLSGLWG